MIKITLKDLLIRAALVAALTSLIVQPASAHGSGGGKGGGNHSGSPKGPITITHGGNPPRGSMPPRVIDVRDHRRDVGVVRDHRRTTTVVRDHRSARKPLPAAAPPR